MNAHSLCVSAWEFCALSLVLGCMYRHGCGKTLALLRPLLILPLSMTIRRCRVQALITTATGHNWSVELERPIPISIRLSRTTSNLRAYFLPPAEIAPVVSDDFVGSIAGGGSVNCDRMVLTPHGNGTHTECLGHISREHQWIADSLRQFLMLARLITIEPLKHGSDRVVRAEQLVPALGEPDVRAIIIRTQPNDPSKQTRDWSGTHPPYLEPEAARALCVHGIDHLVVDLPSIDPEVDGGALAAHRAFWNYPEAPRTHATITELCYIPDSVPDGIYLMQLGVLSIESDASPSQVILYPATNVTP